jgi:hypothetical protein
MKSVNVTVDPIIVGRAKQQNILSYEVTNWKQANVFREQDNKFNFFIATEKSDNQGYFIYMVLNSQMANFVIK